MAVSRLHITVYDFYQMTPVEFFEALKDLQQCEVQRMEVVQHTIWEACRTHLHFIYNMNPYRKKALRRPQQLFSLPWDNKGVREKPQSVEEMKKALLAIHSFSNKTNKREKRKRGSNRT